MAIFKMRAHILKYLKNTSPLAILLKRAPQLGGSPRSGTLQCGLYWIVAIGVRLCVVLEKCCLHAGLQSHLDNCRPINSLVKALLAFLYKLLLQTRCLALIFIFTVEFSAVIKPTHTSTDFVGEGAHSVLQCTFGPHWILVAGPPQ